MFYKWFVIFYFISSGVSASEFDCMRQGQIANTMSVIAASFWPNKDEAIKNSINTSDMFAKEGKLDRDLLRRFSLGIVDIVFTNDEYRRAFRDDPNLNITQRYYMDCEERKMKR
ncbi:hypothetical protein [Klebsiella variicola]|uniref:hypothetical protein n=1 Tax=Klebsiella variicola TaxID=244366 RepID=UPI00115AFFAC|nr:hypothetical protein [Klebsiella variicola]